MAKGTLKVSSDDAITAADLAPNSVDSSELVDGSIDTSHIGANQVTAAKVAADVATQAELDAVITNLNTLAFRSAMITHGEPAFALTNTKLEEFTDNTGVGTETDGDRYYDSSTPVKWYWGTFAPGDNIGGSANCMNNEGSSSASG